MIRSSAVLFVVSVVCIAGTLNSAAAHTVNLPATLVNAGDTVVTVTTGISFGEGPAVDPAGNLYFSDRNPSRIWMVAPGGAAKVFRTDARDANGMVFDDEGRLIVCEKNGISRTEKDSSVTMLLTADTLGEEGPNDLTLTADGGIFFTSSVWNGGGRVFYLSPDRRLTTVLSFSNPPLNYPNGIEYVEEKRLLYVNITRKDSIMQYRVHDDRSITAVGALCKASSPDGLALDVEGNLWVANTNGNHQVTVFDSTGKKLGETILDGQESVQNCAFGGPDRKTLYITAKTAVFSLKTAVAGRAATGGASVVRSQRVHGISTTSPHLFIRSGMVFRNPANLSIVIFDLRGARVDVSALRAGRGIAMPGSFVVVRDAAGATCGFSVVR